MVSAYNEDLWPDDIKVETVISPQEMLEEQARHLATGTHGRLVGHVVRNEYQDRVVLRFEIEAPLAQQRVKLFDVQHRVDNDYPAVFVVPQESLPDYLERRIYRPGIHEIMTAPQRAIRQLGQGTWEENPWVATSPDDFYDKLKQLLKDPVIKAKLLSLLSRQTSEEPSHKNTEGAVESSNEEDEQEHKTE